MITSKHNPHIKYLKKLTKKRVRDEENRFLVEGDAEIANASSIEKVYFSKKTPTITSLEEKGILCFSVAEEILNTLTYREKASLAIAIKHPAKLSDLDACTYLLAIESIEKPGNLGAIIRTAASAGVEGILICDETTDLYHPNVVRNSKGALEKLPIVKTSSEQAISYLSQRKIPILATTPSAKKTHYEIDYKQPLCIAFGSESKGLSDIWLTHENIHAVCIPMKEGVDSLNVSVSAAIIFYEALRQRYYTNDGK